MNKYKPKVGEYKGVTGVMVGRVCEPSYDDIKLQFDDGESRWYRFKDVSNA